jgi:hypothetical protein
VNRVRCQRDPQHKSASVQVPLRPPEVHNGGVRFLTLLAALLTAASGLGCATAQARAGTAGPVLAAPVPPSHEIHVPPDAAPPAAADAPASKPQRTPPRATPTRPEKPDATPPPPAAAVTPPPVEAPAPQPLQTTRDVAEAARRVNALLDQAVVNLDRTDYRALGTELKAEYDTARRFIRQANEALKARNVAYAEQLAAKASTIAARLVQRH